jgi:uncharacterized protein YdhG (YjbR/CyaY superfamily)
MVSSKAETVEDYLAELPDDRRAAIAEVRAVILEHLPEGYVEVMNWGMITYEVPLETCADTYNGKPLMYAGLASQKNHMAVYLTSVYADESTEQWFRERYRASGCKLDMGKSCVRFRQLDQLPVDLIGEVIGRTPVEDFIALHHRSRS